MFGQIESQLTALQVCMYDVCVKERERERDIERVNIIYPAVIFCLVFAFEKASLKHAKIEFQSSHLV